MKPVPLAAVALREQRIPIVIPKTEFTYKTAVVVVLDKLQRKLGERFAILGDLFDIAEGPQPVAQILDGARGTVRAGGGSTKTCILPGRVAVALFKDLFRSFQLLCNLDQAWSFRCIKTGKASDRTFDIFVRIKDEVSVACPSAPSQ